ncbi:hypothetical protein N7444_010109 [Penicillium canescens]|nr:hypothetical protein N7444_010109 [Penicillium canescens]
MKNVKAKRNSSDSGGMITVQDSPRKTRSVIKMAYQSSPKPSEPNEENMPREHVGSVSGGKLSVMAMIRANHALQSDVNVSERGLI